MLAYRNTADWNKCLCGWQLFFLQFVTTFTTNSLSPILSFYLHPARPATSSTASKEQLVIMVQIKRIRFVSLILFCWDVVCFQFKNPSLAPRLIRWWCVEAASVPSAIHAHYTTHWLSIGTNIPCTRSSSTPPTGSKPSNCSFVLFPHLVLSPLSLQATPCFILLFIFTFLPAHFVHFSLGNGCW